MGPLDWIGALKVVSCEFEEIVIGIDGKDIFIGIDGKEVNTNLSKIAWAFPLFETSFKFMLILICLKLSFN